MATIFSCASVAAISGCAPANVVPPLRHAVQATLGAHSTREYFFVQLHGVQLHGPPLLGSLKLPSGNDRYGGIGYFDLAHDTGAMTLDLPQLGSIEVALFGRNLDVEFPPEVLGLPPEIRLKPFLSIDLDALNSANAVPIQAVAQVIEVTNPVQSLSYINGATQDSTLVGPEVLTGVEYGTGNGTSVTVKVTHYRATIDMNAAARRASGSTRTAILEVVRLLHTSHSVIDVWVDSAGRIRKATDTIDLSHLAIPVPGNITQSESLSGSATIIAEYGAFGTPTSVQVPPPADTIDATALLKVLDSLTSQGRS